MRAEAIELARQMIESPMDLIERCRRMLGLLRAIGLDEDSEEVVLFRGIDSEADAWPVGVAQDLLEPGYRRRCEEEMHRYGIECWPAVGAGCQRVLALLSARPDTA